jgi:hypothetical protein
MRDSTPYVYTIYCVGDKPINVFPLSQEFGYELSSCMETRGCSILGSYPGGRTEIVSLTREDITVILPLSSTQSGRLNIQIGHESKKLPVCLCNIPVVKMFYEGAQRAVLLYKKPR